MRRRPIQKMEKSYLTMTLAVIFNMGFTAIYYFWLDEKDHGTEEILLNHLHKTLYWLGVIMLATAIPLFILSATLGPGYLTPFYDFIKLIEVAFDIGLHLDNFCSYCEVIKSETSFHCTICNRCVEMFDHHCPFLNNCIGHRNHKYFLLFIFIYAAYLIVVLFETLRHFVELY